MAINPKIEFFRFTLNPRNEGFKTFRDFAIEELKGRRPMSDEKAMQKLLDHFISNLSGQYAQDARIKKQIKLERRSAKNKYYEHRPKILSSQYVISGVINGGRFGRDGIIGDIKDDTEANPFGTSKSILQYYYVLLYLPLDHNEGCFIVHSNGKEESITNIFKQFMSNIFNGTLYNKATVFEFCPKSFQDEYRKGAIIQSIEFKDTILDSIHTKDGFSINIDGFDIIIQAKPKNTDISIEESNKFKEFIDKHLFGSSKKQRQLKDFDKTKLTTKNPVDDSIRTFEWNSKDNDFVPVVYLEGRIQKYNSDETPDFADLDKLCQTYLNDEVLPELRPELFKQRR